MLLCLVAAAGSPPLRVSVPVRFVTIRDPFDSRSVRCAPILVAIRSPRFSVRSRGRSVRRVPGQVRSPQLRGLTSVCVVSGPSRFTPPFVCDRQLACCVSESVRGAASFRVRTRDVPDSNRTSFSIRGVIRVSSAVHGPISAVRGALDPRPVRRGSRFGLVLRGFESVLFPANSVPVRSSRSVRLRCPSSRVPVLRGTPRAVASPLPAVSDSSPAVRGPFDCRSAPGVSKPALRVSRSVRSDSRSIRCVSRSVQLTMNSRRVLDCVPLLCSVPNKGLHWQARYVVAWRCDLRSYECRFTVRPGLVAVRSRLFAIRVSFRLISDPGFGLRRYRVRSPRFETRSPRFGLRSAQFSVDFGPFSTARGPFPAVSSRFSVRSILAPFAVFRSPFPAFRRSLYAIRSSPSAPPVRPLGLDSAPAVPGPLPVILGPCAAALIRAGGERRASRPISAVTVLRSIAALRTPSSALRGSSPEFPIRLATSPVRFVESPRFEVRLSLLRLDFSDSIRTHFRFDSRSDSDRVELRGVFGTDP